MVELIVQDIITGLAYNLSAVVSEVSWSTHFDDQPGELTFTFLKTPSYKLELGSGVSMRVNNNGIFFGFIFDVEYAGDEVSVTALDQMRYLKNKDTYVLAGLTASQVFTRLCSDFMLQYRVANATGYTLAPQVHDGKSLYEIMKDAMDETLRATGEMYTVYDHYGTLVFRAVMDMKTHIRIGGGSLLSAYTFNRSIDEDTYNQIKLIREDEETATREVYITKDTLNINRWGVLQHYETVDESANYAQIKEYGENLLKTKNRETKMLSLECLGDLRIRAGSGIAVGIEELAEQGLNQNRAYIVQSCTHTFASDLHTMTIELDIEVV